MSQAGDNKRIAKNTIYLYLRTMVVLFVSLYTSRIVLQLLGVEDLGIYNVVGGIVVLMSFFQAAQSKSTSRFITYELGNNSLPEQLRRVFSVCMTIHIFLAVAALALGETIGLWIINHWINIPIERQFAANCVYQFALLTFCIQLVRIPFDAVIVAHEDMSVYAYMSILEVTLQFGMVILLKLSLGDSLILYAVLICFVSFILYICFAIYVKKKHPVYKFNFVWDKENSRKILSFSGWTLLGSAANTGTQQGVSLLLNNFVGLVANAALGFAGQVNVAVGKFIIGFSTAFTPQIIKLYAQRDYPSLHLLITRASKFSFILCYVITLPLIANMDFILHIWLGNVPQYTKEFCQLILVCLIIDATTGVYNTAVTATGNIRNYEIGISISFFLDLCCAFILLLLKFNPVFVFGSRIFTRGIFNMWIGLYYTRKQLQFDIKKYCKVVILPVLVTFIITIPVVIFISLKMSGWGQLIVSTAISTLLIGLCMCLFIMNKTERERLLFMAKNKFNYHRIKIS